MATTGKPMTINPTGKTAHERRKEQAYRQGLAKRQQKTKRRKIELERERLANDVESFLSNGGQIEVLKPCGNGDDRNPACQGDR